MATRSTASELPILTRPKIIQVSHIRRHRSQSHGSSIKKKRSNNVVHISLRSTHNIRSINNKSFTLKNNPSISPVEYQLKNSFITQNSIDESTNPTSLSLRQNTWGQEDLNRYSIDKQRGMDDHQEFNHKNGLNIQINQTDSTLDHHRKKKKKKKNKCRCIFLSVCLLAILLCIVVAITLAILLSKKSTTTVTPSTNAFLRWKSSGITILGTAGVIGANSSLLYWPYGMAFDSSNTLYIADYHNHRIQKLLTGTSTSVTVAGLSNGTFGNKADQLYYPVGILFDSNDNMYITDRVNKRVQLWTKGATSGTTVAGINGTLNISFSGPSAIVANSSSGTIFIADTYDHRIISYPSGAIVAGGNGPGNNETTLFNPYGLVYDSVTKSFVIPNYDTNNIVRWVLGATNRTHVAGDMSGTPGGTSTSLRNPVGITIDPMGNIYVADSNNHRIQLFLAGQSNGTIIAGEGGFGINSNQLYSPFWVILDNQLNLYVSDTFNNRVQKFVRY